MVFCMSNRYSCVICGKGIAKINRDEKYLYNYRCTNKCCIDHLRSVKCPDCKRKMILLSDNEKETIYACFNRDCLFSLLIFSKIDKYLITIEKWSYLATIYADNRVEINSSLTLY